MTTKAEKAWMDAIAQLGCIVCKLYGYGYTPACVHHLLNGGRRIGHLATIPLCPPHHNGGVCNADIVSRHPYKARFEQRYGSEHYLLAKTKELINRAPAACHVDHPDLRSLTTTAWGPTH